MLPHALAVMRQFPFSAEKPGVTYLALHPVSWNEPTILEQRFRPGVSPEAAVLVASDTDGGGGTILDASEVRRETPEAAVSKIPEADGGGGTTLAASPAGERSLLVHRLTPLASDALDRIGGGGRCGDVRSFPLDRYTQHPGPVGAVGGGSYGHSSARAVEEPTEGRREHRNGNDGDEVVGVEDERGDAQGEGEGRRAEGLLS